MDDFSGMWQIRGPGHQGIHKVVAGRGAKLKAQFQNEEMKLLEMVSCHFRWSRSHFSQWCVLMETVNPPRTMTVMVTESHSTSI